MTDTALSGETLSVRDVSELLRVHPHTVRKMYREGKLPYVRIGRVIRFRRSDVDQWVADRVQTAE